MSQNTANNSPNILARDYRNALSCFATGVTVVTSRFEAQDWAMTSNSFASVSLDPRIVLWSIRKQASSHAAFVHAGGYTVSVLSSEQEHLALQFSTGNLAQRFAGVATDRLATGRLKLAGSLAWFDCKLVQVISAGDHDILLGEVQAFGKTNQEGLLFTQGRFGQMNTPAAEALAA